ncbi:hypothetical protein [Chloracidobacterium aggregatum]|jgi:hypothetical protein|uniref:Uncharacterized protein n=1 Tax=Chloracidobacterium sp. N TaxID=2821540 RepID=A0ABX8B1Z7_9BACT|nr:hypothetical protein [Chloracidobacterium aggregatum]QUV85605.1 hypothetical protein J8C03_04900 [Chloracidobacterium sp. 2]QUV87992.1 hypothetical protein J8C07_01220 [Chloracidobacterium sp. S]QUV90912.1 hypothetical protein J8C04_00380 [Chloracidobacterium sp. A]QUV94102.1 hypothetical protein J8C05_01190 [Chloracidobacterium sp. N]QUV97299.1 hypothetical protein J8C00_02235 [Chloracidobacterium sp. E]
MSGLTSATSRINYVKEAAGEPYNIWTMVLFLSAAAYTQDWMPLVAGAALEATYLTVVPAMNAYRRLVERRAARQRQMLRRRQREELIRTFEPRDREMVEYLRFQKSKIYENYLKFTKLEKLPESIQCLDTMWEQFVDLLDVYRRRKTHLRSVNRNAIQNQIIQIERQMTTADAATRPLLEHNLDVLRRRLKTFDEIERSVRRVEAQLQAIENRFSLINDHIVTMTALDGAGATDLDFDELLANIEITKQILEESAPALSGLNLIESANYPESFQPSPRGRREQYE